MKLSASNYCDYYAKTCKICNGSKRILTNNVWTVCSCQVKASAKYRFEQIDISPPELKYKNWSDFTGEIRNVNAGKSEVVGHLNESDFIDAWKKAMIYCFGSADHSSIENRKEKLIIHKHVGRGENVIIIGGPKTGRTLLAALIFKEVILDCLLHGLKLDFKWIKSSKLLDAARWDEHQPIDHDALNELENVDFLAIDGIDVFQQGVQKLGGTKTSPADHISLDVLFGERVRFGLPTIVTCSEDFWNILEKRPEIITKGWGDEFINLMTSSRNTIVHLRKN